MLIVKKLTKQCRACPNAFIIQLAQDVVTTLGFGCILVVTSDNIVTTLSQRCVSDVATTTKNLRCYNVVFSTSVFRPGINVAATS